MARDLQADMDILRTVLNLAQNREIERAAVLAEKTLASGFEHPLLLNVLATRFEQTGDFAESLRLLQRAVSIAPADVAARHALALCLLRLDRPDEALQHLNSLLGRHADLPFAHAAKGNALIALGSLQSARASHLRALELEPGNVGALVALASIATQRGEHAEARAYADKALQLAPGFPDAVMSLAAADLAAGQYRPAEAALQRLIIDGRASELDRARAMGLLADLDDARGSYDAAFAAYETCNRSLQKVHRAFAVPSALDYVRSCLVAFEQRSASWAPAARSAAVPTPAAEHVFLLGFPRSGTTLLEVVLDGHPSVVSLEERELLATGVLSLMREPGFEALEAAGPAELDTVRAAYWEAVHGQGLEVSGKVFIDKHPLNTVKLPLIAKLFPDAKILFAIRDPRDVVLSCFRRRFKMNASMYQMLDLSSAAEFYAAVMALAHVVRPVCELAWHTVCYETLVANFEAEIGSICAFLGIEPTADLRNFGNKVGAREHATPSTAQLSRGLVTSGVGQWRHYAQSLLPLMPVLEPWVRRFGYPID